MEALCVPIICCPLQRQNMSLAGSQLKQIAKLSLADHDDGPLNFHVDILVGIDFYQSFMSGRIIRSTRDSLVASDTVLGCVLSGPIPRKNNTQKVAESYFMRHSMHCEVESEIDELKQDLNRFWPVETIESPKSCVMHQFERDITHNGEQYITKLPFKTEHDLLPDNYKVCKKRLANLRNRLNDKKLVAEYNQIFIEYENSNIVERVSEYDITNRYRNNLDLPICMKGDVVDESSTLHLLGLTLTSNLSCKPYIESVAKLASAKILGIEWDILKDEFVFEFKDFVKKAKAIKTIKRNILKMAASFFDPLDFITPKTSRVKTIFQMICKDNSEWGEIVAGRIELRVIEDSKRVQLHGFCDSSKFIYCAVIYLVTETCFGVNRKFLVSKSLVLPLKEISIPRLELLGCVLLSRLIEEVLRVLSGRVKLDSVICWCDSEVALYWIKGKERTWKPWVEKNC
ncbi:uncharacterized protein LOC136076206 [Hydra vulgaris]|uniref:Uncharacterized protein LOC136076206 n=1 Tax=Hydra vulgaris TaxID=6087 RepID=A0ABM4BA31_HYDVU